MVVSRGASREAVVKVDETDTQVVSPSTTTGSGPLSAALVDISESVPKASGGRKTPHRETTRPIKTLRLKKADCLTFGVLSSLPSFGLLRAASPVSFVSGFRFFILITKGTDRQSSGISQEVIAKS